MSSRGFSKVELIVVIAVIAVALGLFYIIQNKLRASRRIACQNNLAEIAKAISLYASDYDSYPIAGGPNGYWANHIGWFYYDDLPPYKKEDYNNEPVAVSVSASWYLLVRYYELLPEFFVCPASSDKSFSYLTAYKNFRSCWDFGDNPYAYCSYGMELPYSKYPPKPSDNPARAIAADKSPWFDSEGRIEYSAGSNSPNHKGKGQNILFNDMHIEFSDSPDAGINSDDIYTIGQDNIVPAQRDSQSDTASEQDSFIVL